MSSPTLLLAAALLAASPPGVTVTPDAPAQVRALEAARAGRPLVVLAPTLYVTRELPAAAFAYVRHLHEAEGFDVVALEGSALDAWLAQEHLLTSDEPLEARLARAQDMAWFAPWQTEELRALMRYALASSATARPLYLTSHDVQPGVGRAFLAGRPVFRALAHALERAAPAPALPERWQAALEPLVSCRAQRFPRSAAQRADAEAAIAGLEAWVERAAAALAGRRPAPHLAALRRIPDTLRDRVELCARDLAARERGWATYQAERDALGADNVLALQRDVAPGGRLVVWSHVAHALHAPAAGRPTLGTHLAARAPGALFTVALSAAEGRAVALHGGILPPLHARTLRALGPGDLEAHLHAACGAQPCVLDTARAGEPAARAWRLRDEPGGAREGVVPARDLHALLHVPQASPADLLFLGPRTRFAVYRLGPLLAHLRWLSGALGLAAAALLVHLHRRRRRVPVHWLRPPR